MRWLLAALLAFPVLASAESVVLGLSASRVEITTRFDGSEVLIFGAVRREEQIPAGPPLHVVVTVSGPLEPVLVRHKQRRAGIWVNTEAVEVDLAPSFYAIATSGPMQRVMSDTENLRHKVSIPRAIRSVGAPMHIEDAGRFTEALIRIRSDQGRYKLLEGTVEVREQTLFRTGIRLPSDLTEGAYRTRIFLTRGGEVVAIHETDIDVEKVGLERWLFELSRQQPFFYGLMSLAIAIAAGWGASALFRMIKN